MLFVGGAMLIIVFIKAAHDGYSVAFVNHTNYELSSQFGNYIGGVIGTLFAFAGTLLIFLSFRLQVKENSKNIFENSFFEMLSLHRENVKEMHYRKFKKGEYITYENRQVLNVIFKEFKECYQEIKKYSRHMNEDDCLEVSYINEIHKFTKDLNIHKLQLAQINLSFLIVYYGLSWEGERIIRELTRLKFKDDYIFRLLYFIRIKPKRSNERRYIKWKEVRGLETKNLQELIDELYDIRQTPKKTTGLSDLGKSLKLHLSYQKYYGGHQFRLGHYYRHLFQSFKFLFEEKSLEDPEKYKYGKMFRAQLSTYEQILLLFNSLSLLGLKWELKPEVDEKGREKKLISYFNLIKNIPGDKILDIDFKNYYPNVNYESSENNS